MMQNRRSFLKQSAGIFGLSAFQILPQQKALLSFSTLGCPAWSFSQVLQHARENQYNGIEIRGIKGDLDIPANALFSSSSIATTRRQITDHQLKLVNLGSFTLAFVLNFK